MNFTERLLFAMKSKGVEQADLARISQMGSSKVSQLVLGKTTDPRMSTLIVLSDALDVSVDWLAGREGFDMHGRIEASKSALDAEERKLVSDYRDTHDYFKGEIEHFAADQAARHPKNQAHGDPRRAAERGA